MPEHTESKLKQLVNTITIMKLYNHQNTIHIQENTSKLYVIHNTNGFKKLHISKCFHKRSTKIVCKVKFQVA